MVGTGGRESALCVLVSSRVVILSERNRRTATLGNSPASRSFRLTIPPPQKNATESNVRTLRSGRRPTKKHRSQSERLNPESSRYGSIRLSPFFRILLCGTHLPLYPSWRMACINKLRQQI